MTPVKSAIQGKQALSPPKVKGGKRGRSAPTKPKLSLAGLEVQLGHAFANKELLAEALTHRSALGLNQLAPNADSDGSKVRCNERLEFLGDAVLGLAISRRLMHNDAELNEGQLSRMRAALVNEESLAEIARSLCLGDVIRVGKGERQSGGIDRDALLADALEALIGAVFEDAGFSAADGVVGKLFEQVLSEDVTQLSQTDYKTVLQEWTQESYRQTPTYEVRAESGPDHRKNFEVVVILGGRELGHGQGASKKRASQAAARQALMGLRKTEESALPTVKKKGSS